MGIQYRCLNTKNNICFLVTLILSYFQLVLGELVPKRIAMNKPQEISMLAIKP